MSSYLVLDLMTGAMDGFYTNKKDGEKMVPYFQKRHPKGMWILTEVLTPAKDNEDGDGPFYYIPDHMFHKQRLGL